jgi:hypothetical protein
MSYISLPKSIKKERFLILRADLSSKGLKGRVIFPYFSFLAVQRWYFKIPYFKIPFYSQMIYQWKSYGCRLSKEIEVFSDNT